GGRLRLSQGAFVAFTGNNIAVNAPITASDAMIIFNATHDITIERTVHGHPTADQVAALTLTAGGDITITAPIDMAGQKFSSEGGIAAHADGSIHVVANLTADEGALILDGVTGVVVDGTLTSANFFAAGAIVLSSSAGAITVNKPTKATGRVIF